MFNQSPNVDLGIFEARIAAGADARGRLNLERKMTNLADSSTVTVCE
jgi:hypothetical protein